MGRVLKAAPGTPFSSSYCRLTRYGLTGIPANDSPPRLERLNMTTDASEAALTDALTVVREYLNLMEQRDLEQAQERLADQVRIVFPGPFHAKSAADIPAYAKQRYRSIGKSYQRQEAFPMDSGEYRVICTGTLSGTTLHGTDFEGVRFIDVFTVKDGKITTQDVWNDLRESGVLDT